MTTNTKERMRPDRVSALLILIAIGGVCHAQDGAESPAALIEAAQAAAAGGDAAAIVRLTSPALHARLAFETDLAADALAEADTSGELQRNLGLVRNRHGLRMRPAPIASDPEAAPTGQALAASIAARAEARYGHIDVPDYLGAITELLLASGALDDGPLFPLGDADRIDVDGDVATARIDGRDVAMQRERDRWYLAKP